MPAGRRASSKARSTANGWLNCPADPELIFDPEVDRKYYRALGKIGIDPIRLVNDSGHA